MAEYIEREAVINAITTDGFEHFSGCLSSSEVSLLEMLRDSISEIPTADVVKVVRCKDCKYCRGIKDLILPITHRFCCYRPNNFAVEETDYCSYGELKEREGK